ncbi:MAG: hypothetical protein HAW67_05835 [Endozoicomonadaceae bacterium]|nr:hypothetical protein [Endozoicomonadaceae bacterium]
MIERRDLMIALWLHTGLSIAELAKISKSDNDVINDQEFNRKLRPQNERSARKPSTSDLLYMQMMVLLQKAGYKLDSIKFDENQLISSIKHEKLGQMGFNTDDSQVPIDSLTPKALMSLSFEQKQQILEICKLCAVDQKND